MKKLESLQEIVFHHLRLYPLMQPQDVVKLLYQSEFGGGHLIQEKEPVRRYLQQELDALSEQQKEHSAVESIGNGYVRLYLSAAEKENLLPENLFTMFLKSAEKHSGSMESFSRKIQMLPNILTGKETAFTDEELQTYISSYIQKGCPMVSHSEIYRKAYAPAYRVISDRYVSLFPAIRALNALLQKKSHVSVAIDGRAASGKSTAAELISALYGAEVIHMDDFFLPPKLRTQARFDEAGGNVHYERFAEEVAPYLQKEAPFFYEVFDCSIFDFNGRREIHPCSLYITEGSYSTHPFFNDPYDLKIFLTITPEEQKKRILERNGEEMLKMFLSKWIPMEEAYFSGCKVEEKCDLVIPTGSSEICESSNIFVDR